MKLKYIYFYGAIIFSLGLKAQSPQPEISISKPIRYEIGINGTAFFRQFVNLTNKSTNDSTIIETPYYLMAKWQLKKGFLRFGLGASINSINESSSKTADYKIKNNNDYQLRIGYEWQRPLSKRNTLYYGMDILGGLNDKTIHSNSGFDFITISDKTWTIGAAPVAGLRYEIFKNVCIATETSIRFRYQFFEEKAKFSKNTDFNEKGLLLKTSKLDFIAPTSIYVSVLF